jgi:hypothetical protein
VSVSVSVSCAEGVGWWVTWFALSPVPLLVPSCVEVVKVEFAHTRIHTHIHEHHLSASCPVGLHSSLLGLGELLLRAARMLDADGRADEQIR